MTEVEICSSALLLLGAQPITSLDDNSDRALLCSSLYPTIRDSLLRSHTWACATKRAVLAPDETAPLADYAYAFTLPPDFLRLLAVGEHGYEEDHRIEGRKLLMDSDTCYLKYIFRNTVEATWDAMLIEAMTLRMAASMAYAVTQSAALADALERKYEVFMKRARTVDALDDPPDTFGDFHLYSAGF